MAKAKSETAPKKVGNNPFDDPFTEKCIESFEKLDDKCEKIMMDAVRACKPHREAQRDMLDDASARGLNKRAIRTHLKERKLDRQKEALRAKLEGDDQDALDLLKQFLGQLEGTPLGDAAVRSASANGSA